MGENFESVPIHELQARNLRPDDSPLRPVALIVDDEPTIADTLVKILHNWGFAAIAAYDGESALDLALLTPPDLVITDVVMPGMNGIELAHALRDCCPDCRVILFSGQASTVDLQQDRKRDSLGFDIIPKPVHPNDLRARIDRVMGSRS